MFITTLSSVYLRIALFVPILPQVDEFLELVKTSDKQDELLNNVTVFVPSNDAVEDFRHDMEAVIQLPVIQTHTKMNRKHANPYHFIHNFFYF